MSIAFGVFDHLDHSGAPLRDFYEDRLKLLEVYDRLGFYCYHVAEHHATPLGMADGDPLPFDAMRLDGDAFVGDVVLTAELTPLLKSAAERGCHYLIGTDMLFEQIPAYLEFFGYGTATPDELRATSRISY